MQLTIHLSSSHIKYYIGLHNTRDVTITSEYTECDYNIIIHLGGREYNIIIHLGGREYKHHNTQNVSI